MILTVSTLTRSISLELDVLTSIKDLKAVVCFDFGCEDPDKLALYYQEKELCFGTLEDNGIVKNTSLFLVDKSLKTDLKKHQDFIRKLQRNGKELSLLRHHDPLLAEALMKSDVYAVKAILESRLLKQEEIKTEEQQLLKLAKENPFDLELQCKIEEQIRSENLRHNLYTAMEHIPESFSSVSMLYIKLEINGCVVKAFVDSGAQMSILSQECATRCSLMRLLDTRYQGVALGVGSAPIAGRIHAAHVKIGRAFLICSFLVLLEQSVDFILGLDMLKRHNCCIDLKSNHLRIGTTGESVAFLTEHELPRDNIQQKSEGWSPSNDEDSISTLMQLGFSRDEVVSALKRCNGDKHQAAVYLLK